MGNSRSQPEESPALHEDTARLEAPSQDPDSLEPALDAAATTGVADNDDDATPWVDPKWNGDCGSDDDIESATSDCLGVHDPEPRDRCLQQLPGAAKELHDPFSPSTLIYLDEAADAVRHFIDCALAVPALVPHHVVPAVVAERLVGPFLPGAAVAVQDCIEAAAWVTSIPYGLQVPKHALGDVDVGCLFGAALAPEAATKVSLTRVLIDHAVNLRDITYENNSGARFLAAEHEMFDIIQATAPRLESIGAFASVPKLLAAFVDNGGGTAVRAIHNTCRLFGDSESIMIIAQRCRATIESVESVASPEFLLELFREPTPRLQRFSWGIVDRPGTSQMLENDVVEVLLAAARAGFFPLLSDVRLSRFTSHRDQPWYDDVMAAIRAQNATGVFATITDDQSVFRGDTSVVVKLRTVQVLMKF